MMRVLRQLSLDYLAYHVVYVGFEIHLLTHHLTSYIFVTLVLRVHVPYTLQANKSNTRNTQPMTTTVRICQNDTCRLVV